MVRWAELLQRRRRDDAEILRARFVRYRHLLEMNNRVLRLMAAADEKLGGEYLFDAQYLQSLESEFGEAVTSVVHDLNEMSGNRYPALSSALERVQSAVRASLEPRRVVRAMPWTLTLDEFGTELADVAGEKMARLGEIRRQLAITIPEGFVISARACEQILACPSVAHELERHRRGEPGAAAELRKAIGSAAVPPEVSAAIKDALGHFRRHARFAVRSSALGEDGKLSFAGQHTTLLNVPRERVLAAWLEVVASLFSPPALEYRQHHCLPVAEGDMAVGCLLMVPAVASGVIYTLDPSAPRTGTLLIAATVGLGVPLVEGRGPADFFQLSRALPCRVVSRRVVDKPEMCVPAPEEGTRMVPVPAERRNAPAIGDDRLATLADIALRIERHMRCPQDIEWAVDDAGHVIVLQARPLQLGPETRPAAEAMLSIRQRHGVLLRGQGEVACRGVGIGRVFAVAADESTEGFTPGDVVVAQLATPSLSALVAAASAVVCDAGSATGHLATVAREHRVPTTVGTSEATRVLSAGTLVTVDADENTIYEGSVDELLHYQLLRSRPYQETPEFRTLRRMLRHVSPLHLVDPGARGFAPEQCRTYHDIIRFAHERALVELGRLDGINLDSRHTSAWTLELDIPLDLVVIDVGGGLKPGPRGRSITSSEVACRPLAILLEGLLAPGVWGTNPAEMDLEGFMASATRAGPLTVPGGGSIKRNVAIISADHLNLNLRVGYHFNVVDCYLGENPEDSYIFFRFVGGVTDVTRRSRRARLLASILGQQGFKIDINGELVVARLPGAPPSLGEDRLRMVGRLIGFSRQLDILLRDDQTVGRLANAFLQGRYQETLEACRSTGNMQTDFEVMVLDDEPTVCERLKACFEESGMQVETFVDSTSAVKRLAEKRFDVVVTDLRMQGPDGIDVLVTVKRQNLPTQVIIITGYRNWEATRAAEVVGAYSFVDKPFRLDELCTLVKKAAGRARKLG